MKDEEYMNKFLELLRYVMYLTYENDKFQIFFSGFPLVFRDQIEYDERHSLDEVIGKLKNFYKQ